MVVWMWMGGSVWTCVAVVGRVGVCVAAGSGVTFCAAVDLVERV